MCGVVRVVATRTWPRGVAVSTSDFESGNPSSDLGEAL